jgi:hypothetical protein
MRGGQLALLTPQEISGYSTPVITEHLPPGAIKYNPDGRLVDTIDGKLQTGGTRKGGKRSGHSKRSSRKSKRSSRKKRTSKKVRKHRRHSKTGKKSRKY